MAVNIPGQRDILAPPEQPFYRFGADPNAPPVEGQAPGDTTYIRTADIPTVREFKNLAGPNQLDRSAQFGTSFDPFLEDAQFSNEFFADIGMSADEFDTWANYNPVKAVRKINNFFKGRESFTGTVDQFSGVNATLAARIEADPDFMQTFQQHLGDYGGTPLERNLTMIASGGFTTDSAIGAERLDVLLEDYDRLALATEHGVSGDDITVDPGTGETTIAPGILTQTEADDYFSSLDIDGSEGAIQTLDGIYGDDSAQASADWQEWLDSPLNADNESLGTQRDFFTARGMTLPEMDVRGVYASGDIDEENAVEAFKAFGEWKMAKQAAKIEADQLVIAKDTAALALGNEDITGEGMIEDPDNPGGFIPDPNKFILQEDGSYQTVGLSGVGIGTAAEGTLGGFLGDAFGTNEDGTLSTLGSNVIDMLDSGYRTDDEIESDFQESFSPTRAAFENIVGPQAASQATMASGGFLGSAQQEVSGAVAAQLSAAETAAKRQYYDQADMQNMVAFENSLKAAEAVGDYTQSLANVGQTIAATQLMQTQARTMESDAFVRTALGEAQYDILVSQFDASQLDIALKIYSAAAAQAGFDVNVLNQAQNWYMQNFAGALGDPLLSLYMGLSDMSLMAGYLKEDQPEAAVGIRDQLRNAFGGWGG